MMTESSNNDLALNDPVLGFIGLGDMGAPMAGNLARHGLPLLVYDVDLKPDRVPPTARVTNSVAEIASNTDVVFISVPDGVASLAVVQEIVATSDSSLKCIINLSTVGITECQDVVAALGDSSIEYIDAPVSGGQTGAAAGTITIMWSGSRSWFDQLQQQLHAFARSVFYVGESAGQGQALKLLNNYLSGAAMTATSEAVRFGVHHGLDMKTLLDVVHVSTGQNTAISDKFPKRVLTESFDAGFRLALMEKDIALYLKSVKSAGLPSRIAEQVSDYWQEGLSENPDGDFTEIYKSIDQK